MNSNESSLGLGAFEDAADFLVGADGIALAWRAGVLGFEYTLGLVHSGNQMGTALH